MTTTQLPLPTELPTTATTLVGDYPTYAAAQQAVDYLSDHGFPVMARICSTSSERLRR